MKKIHHIKQLIPIVLLFMTNSLMAESNPSVFSHHLFQQVISKHVEDGYVDYPSISKSTDFQRYLSLIANKTHFNSNAEALSFWINGYNALAIKGILDGRSPLSFFGKIGYFYNAEYTINGRNINLYNLEHDIIIPIGEPRIHFALNCASASCPKLNNAVYQADTLEAQLEQVAYRFINDQHHNRFDLKTKTAYLSKIFDWFEDDFANHAGSVQNYLALYIQDQQISNALADKAFNIQYLEYDWSLNGLSLDPSSIKQ